MHKHFTFLYTIIALLCLGMMGLSGAVYAAFGDYTAGEGSACCATQYDVAYKNSKGQVICCKEGSSQGTDKEICCEKAGGEMKDGKCCKCPAGGC